MTYQTLPVPYKEYREPDITFDCINSGLDPVVGTAGQIEGATNASGHSSFRWATYCTTGLWIKEQHDISYTSDGKVAHVMTEENVFKWNPTGKKMWKVDYQNVPSWE